MSNSLQLTTLSTQSRPKFVARISFNSNAKDKKSIYCTNDKSCIPSCKSIQHSPTFEKRGRPFSSAKGTKSNIIHIHSNSHHITQRIEPQSLLKTNLSPSASTADYKRYMPIYPCSNKILAKKWDEAKRKRHIEKLCTMKACIDNKNPKVYHLLRSKKYLNEQGKKIINIYFNLI